MALPQPSYGAFAVACRTPAMILPQHASSQTQWQLESPAATQALNMNHPRGGRTSVFQIFSVGLDGWDGFDVVLWKPFSVFLSRELIYQVLWNLKPAMLCHPSKDWIKMD
jgi:hypothetical protein